MYSVSPDRFFEIDFTRGLAVVMMVLFHLVFDLDYFGTYHLNVSSGFWWWFARITAALFILLAGISLAISMSRTPKADQQKKCLKRGLMLILLGLSITLITFIFLPHGTIYFGILHFIGASTLLAFPLMKSKWLNVALGLLILIAGIWLEGRVFDFPYLLWLGLKPEHFYTFDYFPLIPWLGIFLFGVALGNLLYTGGARTFEMPDASRNIFISKITFLGRHSLLIYFAHQPVLVLILTVLGMIAPPIAI